MSVENSRGRGVDATTRVVFRLIQTTRLSSQIIRFEQVSAPSTGSIQRQSPGVVPSSSMGPEFLETKPGSTDSHPHPLLHGCEHTIDPFHFMHWVMLAVAATRRPHEVDKSRGNCHIIKLHNFCLLRRADCWLGGRNGLKLWTSHPAIGPNGERSGPSYPRAGLFHRE